MSPGHRSDPTSANDALDQQHGEENEEVEDGEGEQLMCRALATLPIALVAHAPGKRDHQHAAQHRRHPVDRIGKAQQPRRLKEQSGDDDLSKPGY